MDIIVTKWGAQSRDKLEFSIGDIVKITDYGCRFANQVSVSKDIVFPLGGEIYLDEQIIHTQYKKCNEVYGSMEWKIIDVGYFSNTIITKQRSFGIRLRNRKKGELLFAYDPSEKEHGLSLVRKAKKQVGTYYVNIY